MPFFFEMIYLLAIKVYSGTFSVRGQWRGICTWGPAQSPRRLRRHIWLSTSYQSKMSQWLHFEIHKQLIIKEGIILVGRLARAAMALFRRKVMQVILWRLPNLSYCRLAYHCLFQSRKPRLWNVYCWILRWCCSAMWRGQEKSHTQATMKCPVGIYRAYHRGLRFFLATIKCRQSAVAKWAIYAVAVKYTIPVFYRLWV